MPYGMETQPQTRRAGRPRDATADDAILNAALGLIAEHGVDQTSTADIAARAHRGKDTIHRRWAHKEDLVRAASERLIVGHALPAPTGTLAGDVAAWLRDLEAALAHTALGSILASLAAHAGHDPDARDWVARHRARVGADLQALADRHGRGADPGTTFAPAIVAEACHGRWLLGTGTDPDVDRPWLTAIARLLEEASAPV